MGNRTSLAYHSGNIVKTFHRIVSVQNRAAVAAAAAAPPGWTPRERFAVQRNRSFMPPRSMGGAGRGAPPPFARDAPLDAVDKSSSILFFFL